MCWSGNDPLLVPDRLNSGLLTLFTNREIPWPSIPHHGPKSPFCQEC
jgi:hypothetical protein